MKKWKAICLILLVYVLMTPFTVANANSAPVFILNLLNNEPIIGTEFSVSITGTGLTDLYAYEIQLDYDRSEFEFVKYTAGDDGFTTKAKLSSGNVLLAHTLMGNKSGISGNATLSTVTFKALKTGTAKITLKRLKLVDSGLSAVEQTPDVSVDALVKSKPSEDGRTGQGQGGQVGQPDIKPEVEFDSTTKGLTVTYSSDVWNQSLKQAATDVRGIKKLSVVIEKRSGAKKYKVTLPLEAVTSTDKKVSIDLVSEWATITISDSLLSKESVQSDEVSLEIERVSGESLPANLNTMIGDHPVLEITLTVNGKPLVWHNDEAPIRVSVPYTPSSLEQLNPEQLVVLYLDGKGNATPVSNSRYVTATGQVTFTTTHLSTYAIAYSPKTFRDLSATEWARHQVEVLASKGIIEGISETLFQPDEAVTRADFLMLLSRTLELKGIWGDSFADVPPEAYYNEALRIARGLGITEGFEGNLFRPADKITREDMMVLTARALQVVEAPVQEGNLNLLNRFDDSAEISSYASDSVNQLLDAGLIHGDETGIHPKATTTRAETAVLMYNIYNMN